MTTINPRLTDTVKELQNFRPLEDNLHSEHAEETQASRDNQEGGQHNRYGNDYERQNDTSQSQLTGAVDDEYLHGPLREAR